MQINKAQILIIAVLLGLVGILVYLNFKTPDADMQPVMDTSIPASQRTFDFDAYLSGLKDSMTAETFQHISELTEKANAANAGIFSIVGLAQTWDSLGYRLVSAHYLAKIANKVNDENSYFNAGLKFYEFAATCQDTAMQVYASKEAIASFEKVVTMNPENIEAKNALAICYVQNDIDIMRGVQLLKDVTKRDSNNIDANYTLGMLSMRSGQVDKAVQRFETLVRIQPTNAEFHYFLGEAYLKLGKKNEAIKAFETFKGLEPSEDVKKDIDKTIINLKNSN